MIRSNNPAATPSRLTFGGARPGMVNEAAPERQNSDVWLNVGYETGDPKYPVVSLPFGIPLDTQQPLKLTGRDADFLAFTGARNQLLTELQEAAAGLKPGEDMVFGNLGDSGLVIQIRRRNGEAEAPAVGDNKFARSIFAAEAPVVSAE